MLRYHQAIFDLLHVRPVRSPARRATARRVGAVRGRPLPPALVEWYGLANALPLMRRLCGEDRIHSLWSLRRPTWTIDPETEEEVEDWRFARVFTECAGVFPGLVYLGGKADDPPVVMDFSEPLEDRYPLWAATFSAWVFDELARRAVAGGGTDFLLTAADEPPSARDLARLGRAFAAGPHTMRMYDTIDLNGLEAVGHNYAADATDANYRFFSEAGVVWIRTGRAGGRPEPVTAWYLLAGSAENLLTLERAVCRIRPLGDKLRKE